MRRHQELQSPGSPWCAQSCEYDACTLPAVGVACGTEGCTPRFKWHVDPSVMILSTDIRWGNV
jgi:hypothetical protein